MKYQIREMCIGHIQIEREDSKIWDVVVNLPIETLWVGDVRVHVMPDDIEVFGYRECDGKTHGLSATEIKDVLALTMPVEDAFIIAEAVSTMATGFDDIAELMIEQTIMELLTMEPEDCDVCHEDMVRTIGAASPTHFVERNVSPTRTMVGRNDHTGAWGIQLSQDLVAYVSKMLGEDEDEDALAPHLEISFATFDPVEAKKLIKVWVETNHPEMNITQYEVSLVTHEMKVMKRMTDIIDESEAVMAETEAKGATLH